MSRAKDTKIIGTSQRVFGVILVAGILLGVAFFVAMFLLAINEPPKKTAGRTVLPPGQTVVVPQSQWSLSWQKLPGERGDTPQRSAKLRANLDRKDAVLVITDSAETTWIGTRQSDGSYRGTWKDRLENEGSFQELIFDSDGKTAHGWVRGTKGERAYLVLQKE